MKNVVEDKLQALRSRLLSDQRKGGVLLVVYPPESELDFRSGYQEVLKEVEAKEMETRVLDFRTFVFEVLERKNLLEKAFELDAKRSRDASRNLANMIQREVLTGIQVASQQVPEAILFCMHTGALFPWVSFSAILEETENKIFNTLVIPFPGIENGPALHFFGVKDGYNYRASRI